MIRMAPDISNHNPSPFRVRGPVITSNTSIIHVLAKESEKRRKLEYEKRQRQKRLLLQERKLAEGVSRPNTASKRESPKNQIKFEKSHEKLYRVSSPIHGMESRGRVTPSIHRPQSVLSSSLKQSFRPFSAVSIHDYEHGDMQPDYKWQVKELGRRPRNFSKDSSSSSNSDSEWGQYFTTRPNTAIRSRPSTSASNAPPSLSPKAQRPQSSRRIFHSRSLVQNEGNSRVIKAEHVEIVATDGSAQRKLPSIVSELLLDAESDIHGESTSSSPFKTSKKSIQVFDLTPAEKEFGPSEDIFSSREKTVISPYLKQVGWAKSSPSASRAGDSLLTPKRSNLQHAQSSSAKNSASSLFRKDTPTSQLNISNELNEKKEDEGSISGDRPSFMRPSSSRPGLNPGNPTRPNDSTEKTPIPPTENRASSSSQHRSRRVSNSQSETYGEQTSRPVSRRESAAASILRPSSSVLSSVSRSRSARHELSETTFIKKGDGLGSFPTLVRVNSSLSKKNALGSVTSNLFGSHQSDGRRLSMKKRPLTSNILCHSISLPPVRDSRIPRHSSAPPIRRGSSNPNQDMHGKITISSAFTEKVKSQTLIGNNSTTISDLEANDNKHEELELFTLAEQLSKRVDMKVSDIDAELQQAETLKKEDQISRENMTARKDSDNPMMLGSGISAESESRRQSQNQRQSQDPSSGSRQPSTTEHNQKRPDFTHSRPQTASKRESVQRLSSTRRLSESETQLPVVGTLDTNGGTSVDISQDDKEEAMILEALAEFDRVLSSKMKILEDLSQALYMPFSPRISQHAPS